MKSTLTQSNEAFAEDVKSLSIRLEEKEKANVQLSNKLAAVEKNLASEKKNPIQRTNRLSQLI